MKQMRGTYTSVSTAALAIANKKLSVHSNTA